MARFTGTVSLITGASRGMGSYGVSEAALINLTTRLADELASGIRVNAVVKTRFARALDEGREDEASARYPLGRLDHRPDAPDRRRRVDPLDRSTRSRDEKHERSRRDVTHHPTTTTLTNLFVPTIRRTDA